MKRSASLLAAVAVAGGSAVVGMPQAKAAIATPMIYWEKVDQDGKPLGGSTFMLSFTGKTLEWANDVNMHHSPEILQSAPTSFVVIDNESAPEIEDLANPREAYWNPFYEFQISDLDPRPGHFLIEAPLLSELRMLYNTEDGYTPKISESWWETYYELEERERPAGYDICPGVSDKIDVVTNPTGGPYETERLDNGQYRHTLKKNALVDLDEEAGWGEVSDENFRPGAAYDFLRRIGLYPWMDPEVFDDFSVEKDFYSRMARLSEEVISDKEEIDYAAHFERLGTNENVTNHVPIYTIGALPNCQVEGLPSVTTTTTAEPSTVIATTTQPPVTSTLPDTTVTNPPVTVTNPGTTVTRPDTTITQPPVVSTIPGTTITKPGTTVTEPAKTLVTTLLGTTVREPGTTVREPGTTVREPDTTVATTLREPDVTVTPDPVTVEKEKPVAVETLETETPTTETSETSVANETVSTTPETTDAVPETSSNSNDARILASTGANIMGFVAIAGLLIGIGAFAVRRRK